MIKTFEELNANLCECTKAFEGKLAGEGGKRAVVLCGGTGCLSSNSAEIREKFSPARKLLEQQGESTMTSLISPEDCELFSACEIRVSGKFVLRDPDSFAIGAVVEGTLDFGGTEIRQGGNFFLPYAVKEVEISGNGRVILIHPPKIF